MCPTKLLVAILTFLAVTVGVANATPSQGKRANSYAVQQTAATHQDRFQIGY
jgi:hypothetical protein